MKDFAAIDFETANNERSSVCSVGIVIVRNGEILDNFYSLIQPEPNYYGRFYKLINSSGSRSARLNLSESVAHPRTSAINSVRLSTHCDVVFDDLTCMDTTIPCW